MNHPAKLAIPNDSRDALHGLLRAWGHDTSDFDIEEDAQCDFGRLFGLPGGVLVLRRRSTGEERLYATGAGSAWFAAISMDLSQGRFGRVHRAEPVSAHAAL
jgi:hypothetical protein